MHCNYTKGFHMINSKQQIMDYAKAQGKISVSFFAVASGMNPNTLKQNLSTLAKENELVRVGKGEYVLPTKQIFSYSPSAKVKRIYKELHTERPFTDFCVYDGGILTSLQHHLSINNVIYVETNRDVVDFVFLQLRNKYKNVFKQPDAIFVSNYINLREPCIIVKTLVTESPLREADGIRVPTLEKLLVDTQKDADFDYLQGAEALYMFQMAFELYAINRQKLMRYAKRRNIGQEINELITQAI